MYNVKYENYEGDIRIVEHDTYAKAHKEASLICKKYGEGVIDAVIRRNSDDEILWSKNDCDELKDYLQYDKEQWSNISQRTKTASNKPSIYFDIDGTLGYWYQDTRGYVYPDQVLDPHYHYFKDIEPHPFMVDLAKKLCDAGYDVCIISSADRDTIRDKWEWLDKNCPFLNKGNIFFCPLGADKTQFIKGNAEISLLIDDYKGNLSQWKGIPIKAINSINSADENMFCIEGYSAEVYPDKWNKVMSVTLKKIDESITKCKRKSMEREDRVQ